MQKPANPINNTNPVGSTQPTITAVIIASILGTFVGVAIALTVLGYVYRSEVAYLIGGPTDEAIAAKTNTSKEALENPDLTGAGIVTGNPVSHADAYLWNVRVRLEDLALGKTLKVSLTSEGKIQIDGALLDKQAGRYELFKQWFVSRKNHPPLIDNVSVIETSGLLPKVLSVWLGDEPAVHLATGKDLKVGEVIGDGWKVMEIGRLAMKLEKQGTVIEIAYKEG